MSWGNITGLPVLKYAAVQQANFAANFREMGHEPKTTFFGDLSIAEWYGPKDVQETFDRVKTEWGRNVEYWTEFVIALNWKNTVLYSPCHENETATTIALWKPSLAG